MPVKLAHSLRVLCSVTLLVLILASVDWSDVYDLIASSRLVALPAVVALVLAERLLASYRWYQLLRTVKVDVGFWEVTKLTFSTTFAGFFLPSGGGTEILRIYGLGRAINDIPKAFASVVIERIFAVLALGFLTVAGLFLGRHIIPDSIIIACTVSLIALVIGLGAGMNRRLQDALAAGCRRLSLTRVANILTRAFDSLRMYVLDRRLLLPSFSVALGFQLVRIAQVIVGGWALHLSIPVWQFLAFMPVIIFLTLLPISIAAGLGVREASFVFFFGLAGVDPASALGMSLYVYVLSFLTGIPGAYLFARHGISVRTRDSLPTQSSTDSGKLQ